MGGSHAHSFNPGLPEPPYSADLLSRFHSGELDSITHEHVRERLVADPRAMTVLAALDRVRAELRAERTAAPPMPEHVAARLDAVIDDLTSDERG